MSELKTETRKVNPIKRKKGRTRVLYNQRHRMNEMQSNRVRELLQKNARTDMQRPMSLLQFESVLDELVG